MQMTVGDGSQLSFWQRFPASTQDVQRMFTKDTYLYRMNYTFRRYHMLVKNERASAKILHKTSKQTMNDNAKKQQA